MSRLKFERCDCCERRIIWPWYGGKLWEGERWVVLWWWRGWTRFSRGGWPQEPIPDPDAGVRRHLFRHIALGPLDIRRSYHTREQLEEAMDAIRARPPDR